MDTFAAEKILLFCYPVRCEWKCKTLPLEKACCSATLLQLNENENTFSAGNIKFYATLL